MRQQFARALHRSHRRNRRTRFEYGRPRIILPWSGSTSPFAEGSVGTKVKQLLHLQCQFDSPTIAVQEHGTYGGRGKGAGFPSRRLCCVNFSLSVLAITSRKIDLRSDVRASDISRPVIVPHAAEKAQTLGLGISAGASFLTRPLVH